MAAISRNTASVAQDFHNAGGGKNNEAQNANNQQNTKNESTNESKRYNILTDKFANNTFSSEFDCKLNGNRNKCENVRPIYYTKSSIVRQHISPPAKQMKQLNRFENTNKITEESNRLVSPRNALDYYIRQIQPIESIPFDTEPRKIYSKLRKLR